MSESQAVPWLTVILFILLIGEKALSIGRMIRKYIGMNQNGDPIDDVSLGEFSKRMDEQDENLDAKLTVLTGTIAVRFNSMDKQFELCHITDGRIVATLRDLKFLKIYGKSQDQELNG